MNNQKILLIDYDPASISKTATPLTKAGYSVEVAKDGLTGLAAFERLKPALVLVEAMLPRKHGFEVCQEIKARPDGKSIPVLITSAVCRGRKYRMDALQIYGCDEYIEKPIPDDELVTLIARLIEQAAEATEEVKQDLSAAIDATATDAPAAIDSMSDDELEAKIDSLLMGDESDTASVEPAAPVEPQAFMEPVAPVEPEAPVETTIPPGTTPVEFTAPAEATTIAAEASVVPDPEPTPAPDPIETEPEDVAPEFDAKSEMERRVAAMVQVETDKTDETDETEKIDSPIIDPLPAVPEETLSVDQFAPALEETSDPDAGLATDAPVAEWTETATPKKGGSKAILFGVAAAVVLGVVGFLAFQQGWIGGSAEPTSEANAATETAVPPTRADAEPSRPVVAEKTPAGPTPADTPVRLTPPVATKPEPVEVAQAEPRPEVPSKPAEFKGRSKAELEAAANRERQAEQALVAAAGSLQTALLSEDLTEPLAAVADRVAPADIEDIAIGSPQPPKPRVGQLFDINDVDIGPIPKEFAQPAYDELARRMRQEGEILVSVLIDETGHVMNVELVKPIPNSRLNGSTLQAAREWVYQPAVKDGVKVSVWKTERILFSLN